MATGILDNIKEAVQASLNVSQMKTLTTPIIVDETEYSTVETALNAINSKSVDVDDELSAVSENPIQNKVITEEINKKLTVVDNMPTASAEFVGKQRLYVGENNGGLNKGGIYECRSDGNDGYEWVLISTADVDLSQYKKTFVGTRAEWDALTTAEKKEYDVCNLTDDLAGGELIVSDEVTAGDLNPVTSNAVSKYGIRFDNSISSATPDIAHTFIKFRRPEGIITMNVQDENQTGVSIDFDYGHGIIRLYNLTNGSASEAWIFNHS